MGPEKFRSLWLDQVDRLRSISRIFASLHVISISTFSLHWLTFQKQVIIFALW